MRLFILCLTLFLAIGLPKPMYATTSDTQEEQLFMADISAIVAESSQILASEEIDMVDLNNTHGYSEIREKTAELLERVNAMELPTENTAYWATIQFATAGLLSSTMDEFDVTHSLEERDQATSDEVMFAGIVLMLMSHEEELENL